MATTVQKETSGSPLYEFTTPALAVTISEAAHIVGVSRGTFYSVYIYPRRVRPLRVGGTGRVIDVAELREAYAQLRDEMWNSSSTSLAEFDDASEDQ